MATSLLPYLQFDGDARAAMTFYQAVFGGDLTISTFAEFGVPNDDPDGVMHSELKGPGFSVMGSDAFAGNAGTWGENRLYAAVMTDDVASAQKWFDAFAAVGAVTQPMEAQVWGDQYGEVVDQFGIHWMFNVSGAGASSA